MDVLLAAFQRIRLEGVCGANIVQSPHMNVKIPNFSNIAVGFKTLHNTSTPVSRLPPEVLSKIISIVATLDPPSSPQAKHKGSLGWIQATHVCRFWRDVILSDPVPWAGVVCSFASLEVATELLGRAGAVPLMLKVDDPACATAVQDFALNHINRASRIKWVVDQRNGDLDALARWTHALSEADLQDLETFEFKYNGPNPQDAFLLSISPFRAARLRDVVLKGAYIPFRPSTNLRELTLDTIFVIWTSDRCRQFFSLLGQAPNLKILRLRDEAVPSAVPRSTRPRIALPKLEQLVIAHPDSQRCVQFWRTLSAFPSDSILLETCLATQESLELILDSLRHPLTKDSTIRGLRLLGRDFGADITLLDNPTTVPLHLDIPNTHCISSLPQDHWFTHGVRLKIGYLGAGRSESALVNVLLAMYRKYDLSKVEVLHLETAKELNILEYGNVLAPLNNLVGLSFGNIGAGNLYTALQPPTSSIPAPIATSTPRGRQTVPLPHLKWMVPGAYVLHRNRAATNLDPNLSIVNLLSARAVNGCPLKMLRLRADAVQFIPVMEKEQAIVGVKRKFPEMRLEVLEVTGVGTRHRFTVI